MARVLFALMVWLAAALPALALPISDIRALDGRQAAQWRGHVVDLNLVLPFYMSPQGRAVWVEGTRPTANADALMQALSRADEDGLTSSDYLPLVLSQMTGLTDSADALGFELAMSQAFMTFARDLHAGRTTPSVTEPDIVIARKPVQPVAWLSGVARAGVVDTLRTVVPQHVQYYQLRQMLAGYRALAERGGWPLVPDGPVLKPGMRDQRVVDLRRNLTARGYAGLSVLQPDVFGPDLTAVVEHFQKRHGLDTDGVAGPATLAALNMTADDRVRQIIVNMERWRWLPADLGDRHVFVNQAAFEMFLVDQGKTLDRRRVIVGKPFHKTPIFSDEISYAEFNPTWTVPPSIAGSEMLPKLINDPSFTERAGYKLYSGWSGNEPAINPYMVDWSVVSGSRFPYRIVQQPGPKNALGQVKFMFPNEFNVYLHDTPSRQLFARTGRAFSHGCIRVNEPLDFAAKLFQLDQGVSRARIDEIIAGQRTQRISLKQRVPVHLAYFSVWIDDDGLPYFFNDVYERDLLVGKLLFSYI